MPAMIEATMAISSPIYLLKTKKTKPLNPTPPPPFVWPEIVYKGIVSDTKNKSKIFMLVINGQTFIMKRGDIQEEVELKEGNRASVNIKYKGKENTIILDKWS